MSIEIDIDVSKALAVLATDLRPAIETGARAVAGLVRERLGKYPPPRPRLPGRAYYIRGKGSYSAKGKLLKPSEKLNTKWTIKPVPYGARIRNSARYAGFVHGAKKQARYHGKHGWKREDRVLAEIKQNGEDTALMNQAIAAAIKTKP